MIIPYKVKNPPKNFPIATVTLIILNIFVYLLTTHSALVIRREIVAEYALRWGESPLITIFTSMFLHGDIFHLLGNMLFLWVFGPAVEDRLKINMYLGLYFLAGFAGHVAQAALSAAMGASVPCIGASGCIMGVLGAYWYMYSWSTVCIFYWLGFFFRGTKDVAAIWVIGFYFASDLISGFIARSSGAVGGVANFAHVGGALIGAFLVWSLGYKRDSKEVSSVKATQAELKTVDMLTCEEMQKLISHSHEDEDLLIKLAHKADDEMNLEVMNFVLAHNSRTVVMNCPEATVKYLLSMNGKSEIFSPGDLLYLARNSESTNNSDKALQIYDMLITKHPNAPEIEMALYRAAAIYWHKQHMSQKALEYLETLLSKFPYGALLFEAEDLKASIAQDRAA